VRRPLRPFSLTVQAYLAHLRDAGFTGAPLPLGVDEQGREVLSFVPGDVPRNPLPPETAGDDVLVALTRLVRALHEASDGWVPPPGAVRGGTPASAGQVTEQAELVSHRDYYPGNVVFRSGLPVALIDFDLAKPTTRLYDIANALWWWAPLREMPVTMASSMPANRAASRGSSRPAARSARSTPGSRIAATAS
jgi:aminoglycoside phosphotransferase (APT) family kinase protein